MANPNLIGATSVKLITTAELAVTTAATAVLSNAAASGKSLYVMSLRVVNITTGTSGTVTIDRVRSGTSTGMPTTFAVGPTDVLTPVTKELPLTLEEGDDLKVTASANSVYKAIATYAEIS